MKHNLKRGACGLAVAAAIFAAVPMILAGCGGDPSSENPEVSSAAFSEPASSEEGSSVPETVAKKDVWNLILVNATHKADKSLAPDCKELPSGASVDKRIYDDTMEMIKAAEKDGCVLNVTSAYRDYKWQTDLFNAEIRQNLDKGMSESEARDQAKTIVAEPGTSEHQTGLAIDVSTEGSMELLESFEDKPEGKWLRKNSWKYGFILRYPKGKENITGITYEPWHFRYVGKEAAKEIYEKNITLEEYLGEDDPIRPAGLTSSMAGAGSSSETVDEAETVNESGASQTSRDTSANPTVAMG